jgi:hypothetical protein
MKASLVYDGGPGVNIPASMGEPAADQLVGTDLENLGELSCRICYDSLGQGRSSEKLHEHVVEVKNLSVYEHCNFTVRFGHDDILRVLYACANRKGVWVEFSQNDELETEIEITANFRAVIEWGRNTLSFNSHVDRHNDVGTVLYDRMAALAPALASFVLRPTGDPDRLSRPTVHRTVGLSNDQAWISLWLSGSRGFTHEQVRHRFAMSQRSTRYVDEDGSPYVLHPLIEKYLRDRSVPTEERDAATTAIEDSMEADRKAYRILADALTKYNVSAGMGKTDARKQARGAARGYLGNALASEMIFSAPVSGWKHMLRQRKNRLADAEIRDVYTDVLAALKSSRYGDRFAEFTTVPSPDGIGTVLA